ncbi:hypothetical protein SAMN05443270_1078 [Lacrimispora sphenoides]|uniref:hypothetical protein n=1 Tax=Lacrimispora sphenoides TaxID=29370 RepID=UPI0008BE721B|nr:hypothetical protein [Lacrimispora sphenoides]SET71281.1 hypothetical protein SAMN05443270_1078 [Lacrimispora sphenoides]
MKTTDKSFAVKIDGKVFTGNEIYKIEIDGTRFNLDCGCESGTDFKISGNTKNLEFLGNTPTARELEGYEMCGDRGFYGPPHSNPADDIEIVSPLGTMKKAVEDALKEMGKNPKTIRVDIDGKQFAKAIKPGDAWHSRKNDNFDGAGWFDLAMNRIKEDRELREAIKEAVREVMEEDAIGRVRLKKEKFEKDRKEFEEMTKKYQGR